MCVGTAVTTSARLCKVVYVERSSVCGVTVQVTANKLLVVVSTFGLNVTRDSELFWTIVVVIGTAVAGLVSDKERVVRFISVVLGGRTVVCSGASVVNFTRLST